MIVDQTHTLTGMPLVAAKATANWEILKPRLSLLVAFSCVFGDVLASPQVNWWVLFMLFLGGFLVSVASLVVNQILERDLDKLMSRTRNRPLPTGRLTVSEAVTFCVFCLAAGMGILLLYTNVLTTVLALCSMVLYSFAYTPLKRVG